MASLVYSGNHCNINTTYKTTLGFYVLKYVSEDYTLKDDTIRDGKISTSDEFVVKAQYLIYIEGRDKVVLGAKTSSISHFFPTLTIVHPSIDVIVVKDVQDTPKIICITNQACQDLQRCYISTNDSDDNYILDGVSR